MYLIATPELDGGETAATCIVLRHCALKVVKNYIFIFIRKHAHASLLDLVGT